MQVIHCFEESGLGKAPFTYLYCVDTGKSMSACQYCGTGIRYKFYLRSIDGKEFFVGSDCIFKSGDTGLINIASRERKRIAKEQRDAKNLLKFQARQSEREKTKNDRIEKFITEHSDLIPVFDWAKNTTGVPKNIHDSLVQWGSLSDNQVNFLKNLYEQAQTPIIKSPCPNGKVTIEGTIISIKCVETQFGIQQKMIVESDGFKLYGSVPKSLNIAEKGKRIRFIATVEQSKDDKSFGFFSRPTQATFIE